MMQPKKLFPILKYSTKPAPIINYYVTYILKYYFRYDSLTGVPSSQRTMAFEKASVLFNVGALYTQIGTKQNRSNAKGLDAAVDNFLRSAGTFQYILENFTNAPSMDLNPGTLEFLVHLMCAQARECLFEKGELVLFEGEQIKKSENSENFDTDTCLALGQEAAHVSYYYYYLSSSNTYILCKFSTNFKCYIVIMQSKVNT